MQKDPDIRRRCGICRGPIYRDERQSCYCPECLGVLARIREARADLRRGPRVRHLLEAARPREHGYGGKGE